MIDWIQKLMMSCIAMTCTTGGYILREDSAILPLYPIFDHGTGIGSLVALGEPEDYSVYKVTGYANFGYRYGWKVVKICDNVLPHEPNMPSLCGIYL